MSEEVPNTVELCGLPSSVLNGGAQAYGLDSTSATAILRLDKTLRFLEDAESSPEDPTGIQFQVAQWIRFADELTATISELSEPADEGPLSSESGVSRELILAEASQILTIVEDLSFRDKISSISKLFGDESTLRTLLFSESAFPVGGDDCPIEQIFQSGTYPMEGSYVTARRSTEIDLLSMRIQRLYRSLQIVELECSFTAMMLPLSFIAANGVRVAPGSYAERSALIAEMQNDNQLKSKTVTIGMQDVTEVSFSWQHNAAVSFDWWPVGLVLENVACDDV